MHRKGNKVFCYDFDNGWLIVRMKWGRWRRGDDLDTTPKSHRAMEVALGARAVYT